MSCVSIPWFHEGTYDAQRFLVLKPAPAKLSIFSVCWNVLVRTNLVFEAQRLKPNAHPAR
jgi:hypothetical protein